MRRTFAATKIWRRMYESEEQLARDGLAFMNNGTAGPMPRYVFDENVRILREIAEDPSNNYRRDGLTEVREVLADFVGADACVADRYLPQLARHE